MSTRSPGAGTPAWFRCSHCRRTPHSESRGSLDRMALTGRVRPYREITGRLGYSPRRDKPWAVEYRCLDCGFVGWSSHADLVRKLERQASIELELVPVQGSAMRVYPLSVSDGAGKN
jgi:predicted RNA-binding Zn-ribbon protein involved in translation (DUF1610 family)